MKLLFKQRFFSWFDSYDIFDELGNTVYLVKGKPSFGHLLCIYDSNEREIGRIKQKLLSFLPKFEMYLGDSCIGCIRKELTFIRPKFNIDYNGWQVEGDWVEWDYTIHDADGKEIAKITKEYWNWTDTYSIDVADPKDAVYALMLVLAIDAEKCTRTLLGD